MDSGIAAVGSVTDAPVAIDGYVDDDDDADDFHEENPTSLFQFPSN